MSEKKNRTLTGAPTVFIGSLVPTARRRRLLSRRSRGFRPVWRRIRKVAPYAGTAITAASIAADVASELQTFKRSRDGKPGVA